MTVFCVTWCIDANLTALTRISVENSDLQPHLHFAGPDQSED